MSDRFFSRARLISSVRQAGLLRTLARHGDAYRDHALVWQLFPGDDVPRDFVFRSERNAAGEQVYYMVSARAPAQVPLFSVQTKPYAPLLHHKEIVRFDLRANPTVTRAVQGGPPRRHDVLMDAKQAAAPELRAQAMDHAGLQWLVERARQWGLGVHPHTVLQSAYRQHRLERKGQPIRYSSLDYQGLATVQDPALLKRALYDGVGHAKGFGCGLLLVKRLD